MAKLILFLSIVLLASCDPCKRLSKPKYKACFSVVSDTITYRDTFTIHDTIITPERGMQIVHSRDTIIETKYIYYKRAGDSTTIICKSDTLYRVKEVVREVKVPFYKYIYKERGNMWMWGLLVVWLLIFWIYARN